MRRLRSCCTEWLNTRRFTTVLGAFVLCSAGLSCSDGNDDCAPFDDPLVNATPTNPEGVAYPSTDLGMTPATATQPGEHAPNLAFHGYRDGNVDAGLQVISLADFYDPSAQRHRLLHLMVAAMWCPNSIRQTDTMARTVPALRDEGLIVVQVFINGRSQGKGPSTCELDAWVAEHGIDFTVAIDAGGQRIGQHVFLNAVPWNALIDTRTMEVLDAGIGVPADYEQFVRNALRWIDEHPVSG